VNCPVTKAIWETRPRHVFGCLVNLPTSLDAFQNFPVNNPAEIYWPSSSFPSLSPSFYLPTLYSLTFTTQTLFRVLLTSTFQRSSLVRILFSHCRPTVTNFEEPLFKLLSPEPSISLKVLLFQSYPQRQFIHGSGAETNTPTWSRCHLVNLKHQSTNGIHPRRKPNKLAIMITRSKSNKLQPTSSTTSRTR
jgi:hypothetical protein